MREEAAREYSIRRAGVVPLALSAFFLLPSAFSSAIAQEWKPTRPIEIIVSSGAGGAADREARETQKFLQLLPGIPPINVVNRPGGGGSIAWTALSQHPGDAHFIATLNVTILTNQVLGASSIRHQDLTPLAMLLREYVAVWTHAASPFGSARDLAARLKKDPGSVSFGLSPALGNQNHIVLGLMAKSLGMDPKSLKIVVYSSGGQGITAALGGHVDVWAGTLGGALPHMESGAARILGISAAERQPGRAAGLPTLREQGMDAVYYAFRGFIGPGGLTAAQRAYWEDAFSRVSRMDEWKKTGEKHAWGADFRGSDATRRHLDEELESLRRILAELGVKPASAGK